MQLKYEMREESHRLVAVDPVYHDAAYAHALVIAISEIGVTEDGGYAQYCQASDTQSFLRERAAELMREWGYVEVDDGEA